VDDGNPSPLVFLHLPKTAGSTLVRILRRQYADAEWLKGKDLNYFESPEHTREELAKIGDPWPSEIPAVHGHLSLHLRGYFPRETRYMTIVRDPVERTISHFHHAVRQPDFRLRRDIPPPTLETPIEEALSSGLIPDNLQTRMLSGVPPFDGECTEEMLDAACANLDEFAYVGVTERFDGFLCLLRIELGWRHVLYRRERVTEDRTQAAELPRKTLEAIRQANQLDRRLHEHAGRLLESRVTPHRGFIALEAESLELANARYVDGAGPPPPASPLLVPEGTRKPTLRSLVVLSRSDLMLQEATSVEQRDRLALREAEFERFEKRLEQRVQRLEKEVRDAHERVERSKSRERKTVAASERLERDLAAKTKQVTRVEGHEAKLRTQNEKLGSELEEALERGTRLEGELEKTLRRATRLEAELEKALEQGPRVEAELRKAIGRTTKLEGELAKAVERGDRLERERRKALARASRAEEKAQEELPRLQRLEEQARARSDKFAEQLGASREREQKAQGRIEELESTLARLSNRLARLERRSVVVQAGRLSRKLTGSR
jgi:hypothetical protein